MNNNYVNLSRRSTCVSLLEKHAGGLVAPSDREVRCCSKKQKRKKWFERWRLLCGRALESGGVSGSELGGAHNTCVITWCDPPSEKLVSTYSTCMSYMSTYLLLFFSFFFHSRLYLFVSLLVWSVLPFFAFCYLLLF